MFEHLPYSLMLKLIGPAFGSSLPEARREVLVNELKKNDPRLVRAQTRAYLSYLDRHGSLAKRFCDTGVRAWVVFGEKDDVGLTPAERELRTAAPNVTSSRSPTPDTSRSTPSPTRSRTSFFGP